MHQRFLQVKSTTVGFIVWLFKSLPRSQFIHFISYRPDFVYYYFVHSDVNYPSSISCLLEMFVLTDVKPFKQTIQTNIYIYRWYWILFVFSFAGPLPFLSLLTFFGAFHFTAIMALTTQQNLPILLFRVEYSPSLGFDGLESYQNVTRQP